MAAPTVEVVGIGPIYISCSDLARSRVFYDLGRKREAVALGPQ